METKILIGAGQLFLLMASYAVMCASMSPRNTPAEKRVLRVLVGTIVVLCSAWVAIGLSGVINGI